VVEVMVWVQTWSYCILFLFLLLSVIGGIPSGADDHVYFSHPSAASLPELCIPMVRSGCDVVASVVAVTIRNASIGGVLRFRAGASVALIVSVFSGLVAGAVITVAAVLILIVGVGGGRGGVTVLWVVWKEVFVSSLHERE